MTRTQRLSVESTTVLTGQTQFRDGGELPADLTPKVQQEQRSGHSFAVSDQIQTLEGSGPGSVLRTYCHVSGSGEFTVEIEPPPGMGSGLSESGQFQLKSPLVDQTVEFRVGLDGMEARCNGDTPVAKDQLERLTFDLGPDFLLPFEPMSIGGTWTVPARAYGQLLSLGGDLALQRVDGDRSEGSAATHDVDAEASEFDGDIKLHFVDAHSAGPGVAVISIKVDVTETSMIEPKFGAEPRGMTPVPTGAATTLSAHHVAKGRLLFDLKRGFVQDMRLDVATDLEATHVVTVPLPDSGETEMKTIEQSTTRTVIVYSAREG